MSHLLIIFLIPLINIEYAHHSESNCNIISKAIYNIDSSASNSPWPGVLSLSLYIDSEDRLCFQTLYKDHPEQNTIEKKEVSIHTYEGFLRWYTIIKSTNVENSNFTILINFLSDFILSKRNRHLTNCNIAYNLANIGHRKLASIFFNKSLIRNNKKGLLELICFIRKAENHAALNQDKIARKSFLSIIENSHEINSNKILAYAHNSLGAYYHNQKNILMAESHYRISSSLLSSNGSILEVFKSTHNFAGICYYNADLDCARNELKNAIKLADHQSIPIRLKANSITKLANLYNDTGQFNLAFDHYDKSIKMLKDQEKADKHSLEYLGDAQIGLSRTYFALGAYGKAIEIAEQSSATFLSINHNSKLVESYLNQASILKQHHKTDESLRLLEKAYTLEIIDDEEKKQTPLLDEIRLALSSAYIKRDHIKASHFLDLVKANTPPNDRIMAEWWFIKAAIFEEKKEELEAFEAIKSAIRIANTTSQKILELDSNIYAARILLILNRHAESEKYLRNAMILYENLGLFVIGVDMERAWNERRHKLVELRLRLREQKQPLFKFDALKTLDTLSLADSAQAQFLTTASFNQSQKSQEIRQKLRLLREQIPFHLPKNQKLLEEISILELELQVNTPKTHLNKTVNLDIDFNISRIPSKTVILRYFVGEERSYLWKIDNEKIEYYILPDSLKINKFVNSLLNNISSNKKPFSNILENISHEIFPIGIDSYNRAIIIPDRLLWRLPFSVLLSDKKYLIEKLNIEYAPSLKFANIAEDSYAWSTANIDIFANSSETRPSISNNNNEPAFSTPAYNFLPHVNWESTTIVNIFAGRSNTLFQKKATAQNFLRSIEDGTNIIHFAGHGYNNTKDPNLNGLLFSKFDHTDDDIGFFFHSRQLHGLQSSTKLIVLNGCGTGVHESITSEGGIGLSYHFHASGVENIISTNWDISDAASADFSFNFYNFLMEGNNVYESLRLSKLHFINNNYHHPYYWAAYRLDRRK